MPLTVAPGKGERTRRRLLDIAVQRFAADGFRRTSVSDIAREAGLTPAADDRIARLSTASVRKVLESFARLAGVREALFAA